jgi:hypothetical protein
LNEQCFARHGHRCDSKKHHAGLFLWRKAALEQLPELFVNGLKVELDWQKKTGMLD